jgi:hypothetical protein
MRVEFPFQSVPLLGLVPPTLPVGASFRLRPLIIVKAINPKNGLSLSLHRAVVDSGADDTVLPDHVSGAIGLAPNQFVPGAHQIVWSGRAWPLKFADIELEISDGREAYRWSARVAFSLAPMRFPLLGQASCFRFFDITFRGSPQVTVFEPISSFLGSITR